MPSNAEQKEMFRKSDRIADTRHLPNELRQLICAIDSLHDEAHAASLRASDEGTATVEQICTFDTLCRTAAH